VDAILYSLPCLLGSYPLLWTIISGGLAIGEYRFGGGWVVTFIGVRLKSSYKRLPAGLNIRRCTINRRVRLNEAYT